MSSTARLSREVIEGSDNTAACMQLQGIGRYHPSIYIRTSRYSFMSFAVTRLHNHVLPSLPNLYMGDRCSAEYRGPGLAQACYRKGYPFEVKMGR